MALSSFRFASRLRFSTFFDSNKNCLYNARAMKDTHEKHDDDVTVLDEAYSDDADLELADEEAKNSDKIKALRAKLKDCETEKMQYLEDLQRAKADFLNSKRRLEEQFKTDRERIVERIIEDFLPLIDSFETALTQKGVVEGNWEKGIIAIHNQFIAILKNYNITEIEAAGKVFNPHEHEAVQSLEGTKNEPPDTILQVLQKGYKRGDTIIRPAKVVIAA